MIRLTEREVRVLRDLVLSHALSRDQLVGLGHFGSVTRCNARMLGLRQLGYARTIETPFFGQSIYAATAKAADVVGERLAPLAGTRTGSPRFLQHALAVTNVRLWAAAKGCAAWRFEQQLAERFRSGGRSWEVRPDGAYLEGGGMVAVEADLGHVAPPKFAAKLLAYRAFAVSGAGRSAWGAEIRSLLVVTTGPLRAARLRRLVLAESVIPVTVETAAGLGIAFPGCWS